MSKVSEQFSMPKLADLRGLLPYFVIALAAFFSFAGTLTHDFVWDDEDVIYHARSVVQEKGPAGLAQVPFTALPDDRSENSGYYRPVSLFSMWIIDPFGKPSPFLYHLVNVALHVLNSLLAFALFRIVLAEGIGAFIGGAIFAVHPIHAESVAWISGRTDLLAALFTLVTVVIWQNFRRQGAFPGTIPYGLGLASFALACLSKEVAFLLPVLAVLWALADRNRFDRTTGKGFNPDMIWVMGWFGVLGLVLWLRNSVPGVGMGPEWSSRLLHADTGFLAMVWDVLKNLAVYLRFLSLPWPLKVYYPPTPSALTPLTLAVSAGFLVWCIFLSGKRHRYVGIIALAWVLLFLGPVSGIFNLGLSVIAERFCYLPSVGFALLAGYGLGLGYRRATSGGVFTILVTGLVALFAAGSVLHASRWKDDVTFFEQAVNGSPVTLPNMYFNLGNAYVKAGAARRGIEAYEEAIRRYPSYSKAILNLAAAHISLGEPERAVEALEKAEKLDPDDDGIWSNKGVALELLGRTREALEAYAKAAELNPGDTVADYHAGNLLLRLGRYRESAAAYRRVRTVDPGHYGALIGLGRSFEGMSMQDEARETYLHAIEERQKEPAGYQGLGRVLFGQGKYMEAVVVYKMALEIGNPDAVVHRGLVLAYHQVGRDEEAKKHIRDLEKTDPGLARQLDNLVGGLTGQGIGNNGSP